MPGPLDLKGDAYRDHVKEQARLRKRRQRERSRDGHGTPRPSLGAGHVTPPRTPPVEVINLETEKIRRLLEPFAARGYEHDPAFWVELAATYPAVPLVVEAYNIASWLKVDKKKNREAQCSQKFLINWIKIANDRARGTGGRPAAPANGATNGVYHQPASRQRNPGPDGLTRLERDLVPINRDDFQRSVAQRRAIPLKQRLALAENGKQR